MKVAVVQAGTVPFDLESSLEKVDFYCAEVARQGAQMVVFPEAFLGGYPKGEDFGVVVGQRSEEGRARFARYFAGALSDTAALSEIVARHGLWLVTGAVERLASEATLYCSVLFFNPAGDLLAKHRKVMPTAAERLIWGQGAAGPPVLDTPVGRLGAAICWENYMPQLRLGLYEQNVQIYCAPTVDTRETWVASMRHIACEGRCYVLSACQYQVDGDWGPIAGNSLIVDPLGEVLAGPLRGEEGVLYAELRLERTVEGKFDLDVAGHYARPDLFGR
jgi:nitrilase